ncbi:hypothetical protein MXB_4906, partial [Myxobolus squamalis]
LKNKRRDELLTISNFQWMRENFTMLKDNLFARKTENFSISFLDIPIFHKMKYGQVKHDFSLPVVIFIPSFSYGAIEFSQVFIPFFDEIYEHFYKYFQRIVIINSIKIDDNDLIQEVSQIFENMPNLKDIVVVGYGDFSIAFSKILQNSDKDGDDLEDDESCNIIKTR